LYHKDLVFVVIILYAIVIVPSSSAAVNAGLPPTITPQQGMQQQLTPPGTTITPQQGMQQLTPVSPTGIQDAYLKVITTVQNNNATAPYYQQLHPRDVVMYMRGILPFVNQIDPLNPSEFRGLDRDGWNFTFPAGTQYDVYFSYLATLRPDLYGPFDVNHSYDCQGILKAGQSKTCFITVNLLPPQSVTVTVTPPTSSQTVSPQSANATTGLTNSTK
jgi:hypothetical protein